MVVLTFRRDQLAGPSFWQESALTDQPGFSAQSHQHTHMCFNASGQTMQFITAF